LHRIKALPALRDVAPEADDAIAEYFWAGPEAAPIGTALHAALQIVAEQGSESWQAEDTVRAQGLMRRELVMQGLSGEALDEALKTVARGLDIALRSERGRWILSAGHQDAHCEWSLCEGVVGQIKTRVVDRSFIDTSGVRWIVDYKTGTHEGADLDDFLAGESERYRAQLEDYARLIAVWDKGRYPVRMGLYFPMMDAWIEVDQPNG
jgi:ATP-dependent exoDNAse (exonuclease V) beta subunit